jgi:hypothetical protein
VDVHAVPGEDGLHAVEWKMVGVFACRRIGEKPRTGKALFNGGDVNGTNILADRDGAGDMLEFAAGLFADAHLFASAGLADKLFGGDVVGQCVGERK